jgi:uncharacterized phage protein (TIGR01671 family)
MLDLERLKFRAWDYGAWRDPQMVYFQGNDDAENLSRVESENILTISQNKVTLEILAGTSNRYYLVVDPTISKKEFELMLYSSFNDCNGKQICQGDIVRYDDEDIICGYGFFFVDYQKDEFVLQFLENFETRDMYPFSKLNDACHVMNKVEIIGNVFENSELLKQKSIPSNTVLYNKGKGGAIT